MKPLVRTAAGAALFFAFSSPVVSFAAPTAGAPIEVVYQGVISVEGHYERPNASRTFHSEQRVLWDGGTRLRLDWATWAEGDSLQDRESTLVLGDRVLTQGSDGTWFELEKEKADESRLQATASIPEAFAFFPYGRTWKLETDPKTGAPLQAQSDFAHVRLGDVRDAVAYSPPSDLPPPADTRSSLIRMTFAQRDDQFTVEQALVSATVPDAATLEAKLAMPSSSSIKPLNPARAPGPARVDSIAEGIWAVERDDLDSRTLVVEMADSLVVIESAVGSPQGEALIDLIHQRWPGKRISTFLFSHHHPHYAGGMRPFIAEGAVVMTTQGNGSYVEEISLRHFSLEPDRLERNPVHLRSELFERRAVLSDSRNEIVAIDIGKLSNHTEEFLIFYFPRQKLLFQSELGWFTAGGVPRPSGRSPGLLQAIDENKLEPQRLIQSWPMVGNLREMSLADLRALVSKPGP